MSHELEYPELVVEPKYDWDTASITASGIYFNVPSIPQWAYSEYDGLYYEGVEYKWDEVEFRLSVDYNSVPESADVGLFMGLVFAGFVLYKILEGKGIKVKDTVCKAVKKTYSFLEKIYTKIITK